jgi:ABC-type xylose transport system permease subunit
MPVPVLSSELDDRTRRLCLETLKTRPTADRISASRSFIRSLPKGIKAALLSAVILTATALILFFLQFSTNEPQIFKTAAILTLVLQNAIMLIFAPVVIARCRCRKIDMGFV